MIKDSDFVLCSNNSVVGSLPYQLINASWCTHVASGEAATYGLTGKPPCELNMLFVTSFSIMENRQIERKAANAIDTLVSQAVQRLVTVAYSQKPQHQHMVWVLVDASPEKVESKAEKK